MEEKAISKEKHSKHAKLAKPMGGSYHRQEWAILGTPCGEIRKLVGGLCAVLGEKWKLVYLDEDHKASEEEYNSSMLSGHAFLEATNKINYFRFDHATAPSSFEAKAIFNPLDAVFINGNHFAASRQIVVIDPRKDVVKKIDRLTNISLVLMTEGQTQIPEEVQSRMNPGTPVISIADTQRIINWMASQLELSVAPVKGLVLAGGKSQRMETDKGLIFYHGKPQREYMYDLLSAAGIQPHLSIRTDQTYSVSEEANTVMDRFLGLGPYGAILSALMSDPNAAWLTVACDLPLLGKEHIDLLLQYRNPSKVATAFYNPETDFPEPLITIWEPKAYQVLLNYLSQGYSCPRKVLINSDIELVNVADHAFMMNANTPDEKDKALNLIAVSAKFN
ncbi:MULTISPECIES: NTP transferase domain-containing protein [unclassified Imperialibacter]|uniref:NTP transferase domain-containing protein n=1 Tax=unclassified Imperialibacter TaxID=2629706 RepID=UPI001254656B|nr:MULTISPECIES: NTP transferase domain-containing protein [unclassified Imperialibacter]CAD5248920.1 Molybdenum cofactor guanylyltransferase [Imperialibacter sp. 89]CAD5263751.1 Molybdenum cofactor guanylyltransferase [Imperialibacter sp. 75]VVT07493.1 Molybdenum cofactor guanylyltransferase [Imperialibacter sp. EC-SDR9]